MPVLSEIRYSREATVAAVTGYFDFLAKMYLNEADILRPPEGGWPEIMPQRLKGLGKTDEVTLLLRHLPYIRPNYAISGPDAGPCGVQFYCWLDPIRSLDLTGQESQDSEEEFDTMKFMTEGGHRDVIPSHVVGLTSSEDLEDLFMLDTQLGVIYWLECPGRIWHHPTRERIEDDAYDYAAEDEADWRNYPAFAIADFFELLKDQFRQLDVIPISPSRVLDPTLQAIYREHSWPDLDRYQKEECLKAVGAMARERYPISL
ncbi:uncharacterized protein B0T15DRAFT_569336 [Chaetomium strumarium]|uniref:Uncharacterized protein n=1 Tax=Chaetomium strumarium TaxID=1170767 RepID=A0AAJ0GL63_9PEZI|nr:hypothetical protein B0T15DRAFT_569336 [Chaetomium strumarium]